ncbi:MAG: phosphatase PAP2 family protein [Bacteroidota bacterium]|nr:phosphatase PAP2 family protein [Bacteroidota bacterium]
MAVKNISKGRRRIRKYKYLFLELGKKIHRSSFVKSFALRFPKVYRFITARFSLYKFAGLPLTFLLIAGFSNFLVFYEIADLVVESEGIVTLDTSISKFFFDLRTTEVVVPMFYFSKIGSFPFVAVLALLTIALLLFLKKYVYILALLVSLGGTAVTVYFSKPHFQRARPELFKYYDASPFSFPSGHSIIAVAFYGLLFYFLIRNLNRHLGYSITGAFIFVNFIGFSRIYLGVHYFTDVVAGFAIGALWLMLAISIVEWENTKGVE